MELKPFTLEAVFAIADDHSAASLYWDDNEDTALLVDATTASMFKKVYNALRPTAQNLVHSRCTKSRAQFIKAVDLFWGAVK